MALKDGFEIARWSVIALAAETFVGFALAFSPGWANDWPFDLTIHTVWSTGMSILFFLLLTTSAAGAGAATMAICSHFGLGNRFNWAAFAVWLACSFVLAMVATLWAFEGIYESTGEMWPNGYNSGSSGRG